MSEEKIREILNDENWEYLDLDIEEDYNALKKAIEGILDLYEKEKGENKEIRQWKYVIDTYADLEKLKELDLIKIEGKEYISKDKIKKLLKEIQKEKDKATKHILEKDYQLAENGAIAQELGWVEGKIQSLLEEN